MDTRLVRRISRISVLYGAPVARDRSPEFHHSVRHRIQTGRGQRNSYAPHRMLGLRKTHALAVSRPTIVCGRSNSISFRSFFFDLWRKHRIDNGGRILLFDLVVIRHFVFGRRRSWFRERPSSVRSSNPSRCVRVVSRDPTVLCHCRRNRLVRHFAGSPSRFQTSTLVDGVCRWSWNGAHRMVDPSVLFAL